MAPRILTGAIGVNAEFGDGDIRNTIPRFTPDAIRHNRALVELLAELGRDLAATPGQVALAWLMAQKPWIVPIPGTSKVHRLEENTAAASIALSPADLARIEDAAGKVKIEGERYPPALMKQAQK